MRKFFPILIMIVLVVTMILGGCAPTAPTPSPTPGTTPAPAPAPTEPLKIGALLPFTGVCASWGPQFESGLRYGLDELGWKMAGRPVELLVDDSGSDISLMMDKLKKMVLQDKIAFLSGPFLGPMRPAAYEWFKTIEKPPIGINCLASDRIEYTGDYQFHLAQAYTDEPFAAAKYFHDKMGVKNAVTIAWDYECGYQFIQGFTDGFKAAGGTVNQQVWTEIGAADYTPYLLSLKVNDGDGIASMIAGEALPFIMDQAKKLGILQKTHWFATADPEPWGEITEGMVYGIKYDVSIDSPINKKFVEAFTAKVGHTPTNWEYSHWESIMVANEAVKAAGGDTDPDKLKQIMLGLKMDTPSGPLSFDEGRIAVRTRYAVQIQNVNGKYVPVIIDTVPNHHTLEKIYPYP